MRFRFWSETTGARGATRGTSVQPGSSVHTRGWDAGAKVTPRSRDTDEFDIYMTTGSHGAGQDVHLGTVRDTPARPGLGARGTARRRRDTGRPGARRDRVRRAGLDIPISQRLTQIRRQT